MWGRLVPVTALSSKIQVYRSALVLIAPSLLLHGELRAPITVAFAASDPYLRHVPIPPPTGIM
jgi:hypothetical protein